jgi:uncharacterized membrane protein YedE/YeeE
MARRLAYGCASWPGWASRGGGAMQWIVFWVLVAIIVTTGFGAMGPM